MSASESDTAPAPGVLARSLPWFKIALLLAAFYVVYRQVSWWDTVTTSRGEELVGLAREDAGFLRLATPQGEELTMAPDEWTTRRFGLKSTFRDLDALHYTVGMGMILAMYALGVARWRLLLRAQGIAATYWQAFRLTFIGFFWNNFLPGMTGGDVAKAVVIAHASPGRRTEAVSTVIVDRVIGLSVLAFLSTVAILADFERFEAQGYAVFAVLGACIVAFVCFFSRRVRRRLKISNLLKRLPGSGVLQRLDAAFQLYRAHPRALAICFGLSFFAHLFNVGSVYVFATDLDVPAGLLDHFATVPIIFIVSSVPLAPAGWGVREIAFIEAFSAVGVPEGYASRLVVLSVLYGLSVMIYSLVGGVFLFLGRRGGSIPSETDVPEPETHP